MAQFPDLYHASACGWLDQSGLKTPPDGTGENPKSHSFVFLTTNIIPAFGRYAQNSAEKSQARLDAGEITKATFTYNGKYYPPKKHTYRLDAGHYKVIDWKAQKLSKEDWQALKKAIFSIHIRYWDIHGYACWRLQHLMGMKTWQDWVRHAGWWAKVTAPLDQVCAVLESAGYDLVAHIETQPDWEHTWALLVGNGKTYPCTKLA
ncbi:Uncharacterised protein [Burkholderia pseudomallei]|nr:Uncharacterised protein [Burkholderia pseudomallei]